MGRQPSHRSSQVLACRTLRALGSFNFVNLGFASLHPRLYASARYAG
ncbi:MAG: hypothetical protein QOH71_2616 [Blastocatellia bacterium]|jgi:hypothetical protein|nr:hypothetical protein [Blastocatellia bacterium]